MSRFPAGFTWGAATAAYQIEGGAREGGRGESIWDRFCRIPGNVDRGDTGDVACDFYGRYREDVGLMRELGLGAFRFSIAWPRVMPDGRALNPAGLDFYDRLVDELLAAGIEPYPTLYHWDLPQALEDEGGWTARSTAEAFAAYAGAVADRLGDRVGHWMTHNEPWVAAWLGYGHGTHAPGRTGEALAAAHNLLLSHGWAAGALRGGEVGIALNLSPIEPASESDSDRAAAVAHDGHLNRWFLDALFRGEYPDDVEHPPNVADGDMRAIAAPLDFLGVNFYRRTVVRASGAGREIVRVAGAPHTAMEWEVHPQALRALLVRLHEDYAPRAIHITENGAAFEEVRSHDGRVRDPRREAYLADHLDAVALAIGAGVPVHGYFVWSLLDNFEWGYGYGKRFGLVYVDYPTLERVPKDSFAFYRDFIAAQR